MNYDIPDLDELIYRIEVLIQRESQIESMRWEEGNL
jgi:hypothetical protein